MQAAEATGARAEFIAALTTYARTAGAPRLTPVITQLSRPVTVATDGRRGVGRRAVDAAVRRYGVPVVSAADADLVLLVVAETVKPEDRDRYTCGRPVLIVLNKADLLADPAGRAAVIAAQTGMPTVPMCALPEADGYHREPIAAAIGAATAALRYRRWCAGITGLHAAAATEPQLADLLASDGAVLATMAVAADVVQAAGLAPETGPPQRAAVRWGRYSRGPVDALHRRCGIDLARGALRQAAGNLR